MQVTGDGEQPRAEAGVWTKASSMHDEPQPGLFEQIFGNVPAVRQPRKEVIQTAIEGVVHGVECLGIALPQAADKLELDLAVHRCTNADLAET
jgi:hypothetical protein